MENKYAEIDKAMSAKLAKEFAGKEWKVDCDNCGGLGNHPTPWNKVRKKITCKCCDGKGKYLMTY